MTELRLRQNYIGVFGCREESFTRSLRRSRTGYSRVSDVTVAVLGINKSIEQEGQDRYTIELPADQQLFIKEAYKANPNTVVVLVAGSSLAINWIDENIPAILNAWYRENKAVLPLLKLCSVIIIPEDVFL